VLKLRAIVSNADFEDYWRHHMTCEQKRVHATRYANGVISRAA
jgi:hypothetical protein